MSRRNKLEKFAELLTFPNVYQNYNPKEPCLQYLAGEKVSRKGEWKAVHFGNHADLVLELACGGGEYSLDLARQYPNRNFIGVDIKGNRLWKGARKAMAANCNNVAFLRTRIEQIDLFFGSDEISEIWITFPDPYLKKSKANRRLTSHFFLNKYAKILRSGATLHLKTDSAELYEFTLETLSGEDRFHLLEHTCDLYDGIILRPELTIKTFYEKMHLEDGRTIKYVRFRFMEKSNVK